MSVFYLKKTQLNFTSNFFTPEYEWEWVDLYQKFWSRWKNSQSCIIRFKNPRLHLEFLNVIVNSYSFFKQYCDNRLSNKLSKLVSALFYIR